MGPGPRAPVEERPPAREGMCLGGRYRLLRKIGRGASATMYVALDLELDRQVAVKVLHRPSFRLRREAQALARIGHPNVAQVYSVGVDDGREFIAMEFVDGGDLGEWQRAAPRTVDELVEKYVQAARGLHAAHVAGIVHRDFKPENVMLGRDGRLRLVDFGLARDLAAADGRGTRGSDPLSPAETAAAAILGTPAYMAPEQLESAAVDARADQFSLCAALYEAIYGVRVFAGATLAELRMSAHVGVIQQPPSDHRVPAELRAILVRGLAADPAARWPSMAALADRLEALRAPPSAAGYSRRLSPMIHACVVAAGVELAPISHAAGVGRWQVLAFLCAGLLAMLCIRAGVPGRIAERIRAPRPGSPRRRSIVAW